MTSVSIVLGFRDWGMDRLSLSLGELVPQATAIGGEVIAVDYGSSNPLEVADVVESSGAKLVRVDNGNPWSRSRALNAGLAVSSGEVIITTDADMLFTPGSIQYIYDRIISDPKRASILQCLDLPQELNAEYFSDNQINWSELEQKAVFRPRYGMGGMIACHRSAYLGVRGFDERMHTYGGEDMDFAERLRRFGLKFDWIDHPGIAIYHIWHPPTRQIASQTKSGASAISANAKILQEDSSYVRNLVTWQFKPADAKPAATVVIVTRNRLNYLKDSIDSVLWQTVQDLQLIVVNDGSSDGTEQYLDTLTDPRITVLHQPQAGLAAGRNLATPKIRSDWTVIHDDDDIMVPTRIQDHLESLVGGIDGTYGGWVDFENDGSSEPILNPGKQFDADSPKFVGGTFVHGTLMIRTQRLREVPYDDTFRSGSDYNLALRLLRMGVTLRHTGKVAILRRLHPRQVTHADAAYQTASWSVTKQFGHPSASLPQIRFKRGLHEKAEPGLKLSAAQVSELVETYGPDHLAKRKVRVSSVLHSIPGDLDGHFVGSESRLPTGQTWIDGSFENATLQDVAKLSSAGVAIEIQPTSETNGTNDENSDTLIDIVPELLNACELSGGYLIGVGNTPFDEEDCISFDISLNGEIATAFAMSVDSIEGINILDILDNYSDLIYTELGGTK